MMKLIIRQWTIALLIVSFLPASADRYEKMWKKTYTYIERDLPKTAIQSVDDIIEYAQKKGDNGQLLKGIITRYQLCNEIAYDSAACYMDQLQSNTDWRTDPGTQALYHLVMGLLYPSRTDIRREERTSPGFGQPTGSGSNSGYPICASHHHRKRQPPFPR